MLLEILAIVAVVVLLVFVARAITKPEPALEHRGVSDAQIEADLAATRASLLASAPSEDDRTEPYLPTRERVEERDGVS